MPARQERLSGASIERWKEAILEKMEGYALVDNIAMPVGSKALLLEDAGRYMDINYTAILQNPYRTVTAEHPFYLKAIGQALQEVDDPSSLCILDVGTGDGRITTNLLAQGCNQIVATDISLINLRRLQEKLLLRQEELVKVMMVVEDLGRPALPEQYFDLTLAIGVLCCVEPYLSGLEACVRVTRPGGLILTIDPTWLGAALYAIVRHDMEELRQVVETGTKSIDISIPGAMRVPVLDEQFLLGAHAHFGLERVAVCGIPLFPSLLFGAVKQLQPQTGESLEQLRWLNDKLVELFPGSWRAMGVLSRKPQG
jgi:2-polyprenyl-3-methyl-5-hydroxy-6-metoxy-1,4-benzoquinol methylase